MRFLVPAVLGVLGGMVLAVAALFATSGGPASQHRVIASGKALIGGPFSLVDQTGKRVTEKDFAGRYMLVVFGFTNCPDVCPSSLQVISAAINELGGVGERVVPVFITVDPARDTPAQLAEYVKSFHPRLVGLTGTAEEIAGAERAFRVYARRIDESGSGYSFDHSSVIYLMDPQGNFVMPLAYGMSADDMAGQLRKVL